MECHQIQELEGGCIEMKKTWENPRILVQQFVPNEYVAACYQLACSRGSYGNSYPDSNWGGPERGDVSHSTLGTPATCGDVSANRVITSDGGVFQSVGEYNGEQGWLNGRLTNIVDNGDGVTGPGDLVFWYTEAGNRWSGYRKWNHWGYIEQEDPNHPNHS